MAISLKDQVWQETAMRMAGTTDRLGMPIDAGIMSLVVALNAMGVNTTFSCEGHLDEGSAFPWVRVGAIENDPALHERVQRKLMALLDAFYRQHPMVYDRHLIMERILRGQCLLRPQGADFQESRDLSERARKLAEYQYEMQDFAAFLKRRFECQE